MSNNSFTTLVYFYINRFSIFKITVAEFHAAVKKLDEDPDVRVILVRAEGKVFTAGLDMKWATTIFSDGMSITRSIRNLRLTSRSDTAPSRADASLKLNKLVKRWQDSFSALEKTLKPVIAAVHGSKCHFGCNLQR